MILSDSSSPLYVQIVDSLRAAVSSGVYLPGQRIPSELELCENFNVSRITVRRAVSELVEEGLLEKKQGKGVYVSQPKNVIHAMAIMGFSGFRQVSEGNVRIQILSKTKRHPSVKEARQLAISIQATICELSRVLYINDMPMMYDRSIFSENRFPNLLEEVDERTSTYQMMDEVYHHGNYHIEKEITMTYARPGENEILQCKIGETLFYIEKISYDDHHEANHISKLLCVAARTRLTMSYDRPFDFVK